MRSLFRLYKEVEFLPELFLVGEEEQDDGKMVVKEEERENEDKFQEERSLY